MPKAYKYIIFNNLDGVGSKTQVDNIQTGVHSCFFSAFTKILVRNTYHGDTRRVFLRLVFHQPETNFHAPSYAKIGVIST